MTEKTTIIAKRGPAIDAALVNLAKGLEGLAGKPADKLDEVLEPVFKALGEELKGIETAIKKDDIDDGAQDFNSVYRTQAIQQTISQVMSPMYDLTNALRESIGSIIRDDSVADKSAKVRESVDQFKDAVMGLISMVEDVVDSGNDEGDAGDGTVGKDDDGTGDDTVMDDDDVEKACADARELIVMGVEAPQNQGLDVVPIHKSFLGDLYVLMGQVGRIAKRGAPDHSEHLDAIHKGCSDIMKSAGAIGAIAKDADCGSHIDNITKCASDIMKRCGAMGAGARETVRKDPPGTVEKAASGGGDGNSAAPGNQEGHMAEDPKAGAAGDIKKMFEDLSGSITKSLGEQISKAGEQIAAETKKQVGESAAEITKRLDEMDARLKKVEGAPAATAGSTVAKGATAVGKDADGARSADDEVVKRAAEGDALAITKLALRTPAVAAAS